MSASAFAKTIVDKMKSAIGTDGQSYDGGSASSAMIAVADGITEYILNNTEVQISYVGVIPGTPPTPDPIISDSFKLVGACMPTGPSNGFDEWIKLIEANIISGFQLATMGEKGVSFPTMPFLSPGIMASMADLTSLHSVDDEAPQMKVWEFICSKIMEWINSTAMNPTPGPASRVSAPSSGTASISKIIIV